MPMVLNRVPESIGGKVLERGICSETWPFNISNSLASSNQSG